MKFYGKANWEDRFKEFNSEKEALCYFSELKEYDCVIYSEEEFSDLESLQ